MFALWKNSIGTKLFCILAAVIALAMMPIAVAVFVSVNTFGNYSATINEDQIRLQAVSYLSRLAKEQGRKYEEYFNRLGMAATLMSTEASNVYSNLGFFARMAEGDEQLHWQRENAMFITPLEAPVVTLYWGGDALTPEIRQEILALKALDPMLKKIKELLPESLAVHMITSSGIGRYYTLSEEGREVVRHLPKTTAFDLRDGAPMNTFTRGNHPHDRAEWTGIYKDDVLDGLMVTVCGPIVDQDGVFRGVTGIDFPLQAIIDDVMMDADSSEKDGGQVLFSFLVDSRGQIIAFPVDYMKFFGIDIDFSTFKNSSDLLQYNLKDSREEGVRSIASQLIEVDNSVHQIVVQGENLIIAGQTLPTQGWNFFLVTKEDDILSSVHRTQNALRGTLKELKNDFFLNSIVIGCIALFLVSMAIRYFVSPLKKIASIAEKVGEGDLSNRCELGRKDELGILAYAMNDMIIKLSEADEIQNTYSKTLEEDIKKRTSDLELKNQQLNNLILNLRAESRERKKAALALQESEKQLRSIMESALAGLCIIQQGKFRYVNLAVTEMFGYSRKQFIEDIQPADIILPEFWDPVQNRLVLRDKGQLLAANVPYHIRCRTKDGEIIDTLVEEATTSWQGSSATVGTIVDITPLKQVEERLRENEKRLKDLIEEKDVLLREVNHRTKNNMLVIISMLALQMDGIEDKNARRVFVETENRIRAMALVHENLYKSKNLTKIDLGQYLENLVETLIDTMTVGKRIRVKAEYTPVTISFDQAISLGLVVNELVTNSIKYAFPAGSEGEIRLNLHRQEDTIILVVADNGIGLPADIDVHKSESFGLQISASMITRQLRGDFSVNRDGGTAYAITFKHAV